MFSRLYTKKIRSENQNLSFSCVQNHLKITASLNNRDILKIYKNLIIYCIPFN